MVSCKNMLRFIQHKNLFYRHPKTSTMYTVVSLKSPTDEYKPTFTDSVLLHVLCICDLSLN